MARIVLLKEAAKQTGLTYGELYSGVRNGKYPGFQVGSSNHGRWVTDLDLLNRKIKEMMEANIKGEEEVNGTQGYGTLRRVHG